jgi:tetratricopeptide (TPR) repeat protein
VARCLYDTGRYDEAVAHFRQGLSIQPESGGLSQGLAMTLIAMHRYDEGIAEAEKARMLMGGDAMITSDVGYAYAVAGRGHEAREILNQLLHWPDGAFVRALPVAHVYLGLGDRDRAFEWLNKAIDQKDANVYLKADPRYSAIRSDPRFAALLRRAKL